MKRTVNPPIDAALAANSLARLWRSEIMSETVLMTIVSMARSIVLDKRVSWRAEFALLAYKVAKNCHEPSSTQGKGYPSSAIAIYYCPSQKNFHVYLFRPNTSISSAATISPGSSASVVTNTSAIWEEDSLNTWSSLQLACPVVCICTKELGLGYLRSRGANIYWEHIEIYMWAFLFAFTIPTAKFEVHLP